MTQKKERLNVNDDVPLDEVLIEILDIFQSRSISPQGAALTLVFLFGVISRTSGFSVRPAGLVSAYQSGLNLEGQRLN